MTSNQVAYWNLQELKRSNLARETETSRHDIVSEQLQNAQNQETGRHNLQQEVIGLGTLKETQRHNVAGEMFNLSQLQENKRHSMVTEQETSRHNVAQEDLGWENADISRWKAEHDAANQSRANYIQAKNVIYQHRDRGESNQLQAEKIALDYSLGLSKQRQDWLLGRESNQIGWMNADSGQQNADTNYYNAETNDRGEQHRFWVDSAKIKLEDAKNSETNRHNRMDEFNKFGSWTTNLFGGTLRGLTF